MQALLELAPLVAFFVAYHFGGIYIATGVLMAGMAVLLAVGLGLALPYLVLSITPALLERMRNVSERSGLGIEEQVRAAMIRWLEQPASGERPKAAKPAR